MILDFVAPFLIGFVGSLHCLGMCGPLVMAYSLHIGASASQKIMEMPALWSRGLSHHTAFHLGRLCTYGMLGALAAGVAHLASFDQLFTNLRSGLTLLGGILMVLFGLLLLKVFPIPLTISSAGPSSIFGRWFPPLFRSQRIVSKVALGLITGFLPCMLTWAMIVKAATTQNLWGGFLTMISFGLGTVPALFLTGLSASLLSLRVRIFGERVAALSVIVMGFILVFKGSKYFA